MQNLKILAHELVLARCASTATNDPLLGVAAYHAGAVSNTVSEIIRSIPLRPKPIFARCSGVFCQRRLLMARARDLEGLVMVLGLVDVSASQGYVLKIPPLRAKRCVLKLCASRESTRPKKFGF
jgi:hypothetical protein